jgi:serine/threonine protein kinase
MGAVYKAHHEIFDELRALKVMNADLVRDEVFVKRFKQEAVIARKLDHPNAVRVHDIDEAEDGRPFIVMEYIEGVSLKKVIQDEGRLTPARACSIAVQVAGALDSAHRIGMVHRDIKPANIVLVPDPEGERAKVLDFGVAKLKEARAADRFGATLTGTGMVVGTPQYMSPEQALGKRGDELDGRSDLYSLGVVMYQMLTGELPFTSDTTMGLLMAHINSPPRPMLEAHRDLNLPPGLMQLVMRCLEKDPEMRPPSGAALIREVPFLQEMEWANGPTQTLWVAPQIRSRQVQSPMGGMQALPLEAARFDPSMAATAIRLSTEPTVADSQSTRPVGAPEALPLAAGSPKTRRLIVAVIAAIVILGAGFAVWRFDSYPRTRASHFWPGSAALGSGSAHGTHSTLSARQPGPNPSLGASQPIGGAKIPGASTTPSRTGQSAAQQVGASGGTVPRLAAATHREVAVRPGQQLQASSEEGSAPRRSNAAPSYVSEPANVAVVVLTAPRATVFMDGKQVGTADTKGRLEIRGATPGIHDLRLALVGFPNLYDRINVPPAYGATSTIMVATKAWGEPQNGPNSLSSPKDRAQPKGKPFQASFGVVHVHRFGLAPCKGVLVIQNDSLQFHADNGKDSFTTPLDGVIWTKNTRGDFHIRLPSGKEYTFRTEAASAIIAAIDQALGQPNSPK